MQDGLDRGDADLRPTTRDYVRLRTSQDEVKSGGVTDDLGAESMN